MNPAVKPSDDFFEHANDGWLKTVPIPPDCAIWGVPMELTERNLQLLRTILEDLSRRSDWPKGSIRQKLSNFYASGMDEAAIEKQGLQLMAGRFGRIQTIRTAHDVAVEVGRIHREGGGALFSMYVGVDDKASTRGIVQFIQGGIGLPDRDYDAKEGEESDETRTKPFVKQYAAFRPLPDLALNGELTLGENIADLGGVRVAYAAYVKALEGKDRPAEIDGFTPEQRFFISYAQGSFRRSLRPEYLRVLVNTGPHSPATYRVNGPLANMPEFFRAFGCGEKGAMVLPAAERATVW